MSFPNGFIPVAGPTAVLTDSTGNVQPGVNWKINIDPKITKGPSNFRDGRISIGTLTDGQLTFRLVWDANNPATKASGLNLRPGAQVSLRCYVDAVNYFIFPGCVGPLGPENEGLEGIVGMDVTVELSGTITFPANG